MIWGTIVKALAPLGGKFIGKWFKSKDFETKTVADWEHEAIKASKGSWKDEFLTLVFASPIVLQVIGAIVWAFTVERKIFNDVTIAECEAMTHLGKVNYLVDSCIISVGNSALLNAADMIYDAFARVGLDYTQVMLLIIGASFGVHVSRTMQNGKRIKAASEIVKAKSNVPDFQEGRGK